MALCSACRRVNLPNLLRDLDNAPNWWAQHGSQSKPRGMVHLCDARQLPVSAAEGCPLCGMIVDAVLQHHYPSSPALDVARLGYSERDIGQWKNHLIDRAIYLRPNYDPTKPAFPEEDVAGAWHVRGFKAFVPVDHGILTGQIRLFAMRESPAALSCDVVGRPALPSSDSPEAFDLARRWMNACLARHEACRETFCGNVIEEATPPTLPTRVIHIGQPNGAICPRLIETKGDRGYYVALSHCWGSGGTRHPLMTTESTYQSHLAGIPWDTIPKAYQDAITASHRLGFEWIWIDSLCIIQDSHSDWLYESQRMGAVYENARLTIAASHASDSSEPCFFERPSALPALELPHLSQSGQLAGSIFATLMPTDYASISPEFGALAYRAWATQEWLLSRRMIFYTLGCLVWSCKMISQRETGASFHSTARNPRWKNIVEKYSARLLTKPTDRLIALEGLRTEMGKKRPNDIYCCGIWKNSMPDQLLWYCLKPSHGSKVPLDLPSWTWASRMVGVRFLDMENSKNACHGFRFDEASEILCIRGAAIKMASVGTFVHHHSEGEARTPQNILALISKPPDTVPLDMVHSLVAQDGFGIGWVVLDEGLSITANVTCLRLMTKKVSLPGSGSSMKRKAYRDLILVLRLSEGRSGVFERLGVGAITTTGWFDDQTDMQVRIH